MKLKFTKYQGTGNDFVIIDNRDGHFDSNNVTLVNFLCDRRMGIGGDGLMLLENHENESIDFTMRYYNADGKEASMCGNGGRCIAAFAVHIGAVKNTKHFLFDAVDGIHEASYNEGIVSLKMMDVLKFEKNDKYTHMDTGSPHYVSYVTDIKSFDVFNKGKSIRHDDTFAPGGTNVNFVEEVSPTEITVRTFERGVEDETLSCGTGVVASALSTYIKNKASNSFNINVEGGKLKVHFEPKTDGSFKNIWLIGPATKVFEGTIVPKL